MVQRKLGIQADSIKPEKRLGSFKPSSYQHQDGSKNKGADLKIKMKKCRSVKVSDIEGLRSSFSSSPLRKTIAQPGKPPPLNVQAAAVKTPQKNSMIKALDGSPNYMKSTSSSEAKKETSQVSSGRNLRRRSSIGSKISSASSCDKTSSLKLVRTLTKSPSFKPARASVKKCSRVATCSSTLKDSKFPSYLMLNPGGTESEGTSIIKVCPYTYCSLNGHHHTPLPPLKCFLKARRRSLKIQRSMKMEALSPRRKRSSGDGIEEFDETASNGVDLGMIKPSPLMPLDFFIEIYSKGKENDAEETRGSSKMKAKGMDDSGCGNETAPELGTDKPVSESLSEGSPHSEIDFDENSEHCEEDNDLDVRGILVKEESSPWNLSDGDEQECVSTIGEVIDMEWEEEGVSTLEPDREDHSSIESDLNIAFHEEFVISSHESDSNISEEILADGADFMGIPARSSEADSLQEVPENSCTIDLKDEAFESTQHFKLQLHSFDELQQDETNEDYKVIQKPGDSEADQAVPSAEGGDKMEAGKVADAELFTGIQISDTSYVLYGEDEVDNEIEYNQFGQVNDESFSIQDAVEESFFADHLSDGQHENANVVDNQCVLEEDQDEPKFKFHASMDSKEQKGSKMRKTSLAEDREDAGKMELEDNVTPWMDVAETSPAASDKSSYKPRRTFSFNGSNAKEELSDNQNNRRWTIGHKRQEEKYEESRIFNPREPNFLPVVPEPDAEKVDLRHQMMDERKNAEEWMLDHALQQAVTKLAPARKRKVALLVEAFETVLPITKCETHLRHTSTGFAHGRPVQACN